MSLDPISAIFDTVNTVITRIFPDATQAAAAKLELLKMQENGELQAQMGQLDINKVEASSSNWFVAGWRPYVGWITGTALAYVAIAEPIARFISQVWFHYLGAFPVIDTTLTSQVLFAMLGLGAMRTYEKKTGTEGNR